MMREYVDKQSGAILFKPDEESKSIEILIKSVKSLEKKVTSLEKKIKELESQVSTSE